MNSIYIIGALANPRIPEIAIKLRNALDIDVFDDWHGVGPEADMCWQAYEKRRGRPYHESLNSYHAQHVFAFDKYHLDRCSAAVLVMPCGKSGHLELGYTIGRGKPGYILLDGEPDRVDVMHAFATKVFVDVEQLAQEIYSAQRKHGSLPISY